MFDVITVGSATRDIFVRSREFRKFHSSRVKTREETCFLLGSKITIDELHFFVGGGAVNTAVTFANQGFRVAAIASVGDDLRGQEIIRILKDRDIVTDFIHRDPHDLTAYSIILSLPNGERTILRHFGAVWHLHEALFDWSKLKARCFYLNHIGGKSAVLLPRFLKLAAKQESLIALNPGETQLSMGKRLIPLLKNVDVFFVNQEEASILTGIPFSNSKRIFRVLDSWVKGIVVMTKGPRGVEVSDGHHRWSAGVLPLTKIIDRTGAGDAFGSGFIAALLHRPQDIEYAIQFGSANATATLTQWGANEGLLHKGDSIYTFGTLKIVKQKVTV